MSAIAPTTRAADDHAPAIAPDLLRLWGCPPVELHDRIWASRGVCVVRPASTCIPRRGPGLYLLLHHNDLVDFSIADARDELFETRAQAIHARLTGPSPPRHDEVVRRDPAGAFVSVARVYPRGAARSASCWVTASPRVASYWAQLSHPGASRRLKARLGGAFATARLAGSILDPRDEHAFARWLCDAAAETPRLTAVIPLANPLRADVWAHRTAEIGERVRFAGPVLVGAGVRIPDGATVIGPVILEDESTPPQPAPVDWTELSAPLWNISRSTSRGSFYAATKRVFDVVLSLLVLVLTAPLALLVMLLIFLEDGRPFFFSHTRQTRRGRNFPCLKFRTMVKDAESRKLQLATSNQADGPQFFIKDDPRLLKVGVWLRRFQVDELPQFWNVLVGDMSIVGPRPSPDRENQFCPAWRDARLSVRPGITGLWQVRRTRAPDTDFQEWIRYDLDYVQRRSWRLDLWIILLTTRKILNG